MTSTKPLFSDLPREFHGVLEPALDPVSRKYLSLIQNGCKLPDHDKRNINKRVLIVGAGMAGLVAATFASAPDLF